MVRNRVVTAELLDVGENCTGIVRHPVGIHLNKMGRVVGTLVELLSEEMLFLAERQQIVIIDGRQELSLPELFDRLLSENTLFESGKCSLFDYKVYSYLKNNGFTIKRYYREDHYDPYCLKLPSNQKRSRPFSKLKILYEVLSFIRSIPAVARSATHAILSLLYHTPGTVVRLIKHHTIGRAEPNTRPLSFPLVDYSKSYTNGNSRSSVKIVKHMMEIPMAGTLLKHPINTEQRTMLDLYKPGRHYKRKHMGPPNYRVITLRYVSHPAEGCFELSRYIILKVKIKRSSDDFPEMEDISPILGDLPEGCALLVALADESSLSFFNIK